MKTHEKLLEKIEKQFPDIAMPIDARMRRIARVHGGDRFSRGVNRIVFKWANFGVGESHVFSYNTMTDCLNKPVKAVFHNGIGGLHGWEIEPIE